MVAGANQVVAGPLGTTNSRIDSKNSVNCSSGSIMGKKIVTRKVNEGRIAQFLSYNFPIMSTMREDRRRCGLAWLSIFKHSSSVASMLCGETGHAYSLWNLRCEVYDWVSRAPDKKLTICDDSFSVASAGESTPLAASFLALLYNRKKREKREERGCGRERGGKEIRGTMRSKRGKQEINNRLRKR